MVSPPAREITQLLHAWSRGDGQALDRLTPLVYAELHRTAQSFMAREQTGHTLQTTALINEVYLRLVDFDRVGWQDRAHFFAVCARLMRRILTDFARARQAQKRGGGAQPLSLDEGMYVSPEPAGDLVALDAALNRLAALDERKSQVVELRFFGGLTAGEAAEVLKISEESVKRDWRLAKLWLLRELSTEQADGR